MAFHSGFVTDVVAQVVISSPTGSGQTTSVSGMVAQLIIASSPKAANVSSITAQAVLETIPYRTQVGALMAQVLVQNLADSGGKFYNAGTTAQVVTTLGVPDTERQKAWTFDHDGHTFYVLDLAERGALCYNLTTQSWSNWDTAGYEGHFNMKNGFHWRDGKQVVGGGILAGLLVAFDPDTYIDEGFRPVSYEINGVIFASSEAYIKQYALRLVGSPARTGLYDVISPPILNMSFSDDNGATWSDPRALELSMSDTSQRLEFRSLGAFSQPGRLFRMFDSGGIKFLAYVVADLEGE